VLGARLCASRFEFLSDVTKTPGQVCPPRSISASLSDDASWQDTSPRARCTRER
jgi:hypothetical protein